MTQPRTAPTNALASQVADLANAAVVDAANRRKVSAERRKQTAAVEAWLSKERAVLVAFILAVPVLALVIYVNVMNKSLADLFSPAPTPQVSRQIAQEALDTVVKRIDSFYNDYDELPGNLVEVGLPTVGDWTWAPRSDGQYEVTVKMFSQTLTFDTRQHASAR